MRSFCGSRGFDNLARGMQGSSVAWRVAKNYLHGSNHAIKQLDWPDASPSLAMPMLHDGNGQKIAEEGNEVTATLPANLKGDYCNSGTSEPLCGMWYEVGWETAGTAATDPEDWGFSSWGRNNLDTYMMCLQKETFPSAIQPVTKCSPSSPNGEYTITADDGEHAVWCDTASDPGSVWRLKAVRSPTSSDLDTPGEMRSFCSPHGFDDLGNGVDEAVSWLVAKRYLHDSNHAIKQAGFPSGGSSLVMPMMHDGTSQKIVQAGNEVTATLPDNLNGDHCTTGESQQFCGYWHANGWNTDDKSLPDPEDWGTPHFDYSDSLTYMMCMQKEV